MNISTGGPHILFFERDQQLTALLTSEFQLAGYECHAARTAVEVFDTIARFPVRILLVNLAQAAAGRREFWVALDTQRRGRGVQVFTYLCSNLAGFGPRDTDERSQAQIADIEIDGMLGLMNLVETVRERVSGPGTGSSTPTQNRQARTNASSTTPTTTSPVTQPNTGGTTYRTGPSADTPRTGTLTAPVATQAPPSTAMQQSYSEKIRAVLYPTQRPTNVQVAAANTDTIAPLQETERPAAYNYAPQQSAPRVQYPVETSAHDADSTALQRLAYGEPTGERESGLDQLSRLLQERSAPISNEAPHGQAYQAVSETPENRYASPTMPTMQNTPPTNYTSTAQTAQATDAIGTQPLRASPIEDLPRDRTTTSPATSDGMRRSAEGTTHANYGQYGYAGQTQNTQTSQITPLASISMLRAATPPAVAKATMPIPVVTPSQERPNVPAQPVAPPQPVQEVHSPQQPAVQEIPVAYEESGNDEEMPSGELPVLAQQGEDEEEGNEVNNNRTLEEQQAQQVQTPPQKMPKGQDNPDTGMSPNNAIPLDIVQSLPVLASTAPQPPTSSQAVSGRTMRTLGSVLLEGHLVPQSRLEVAQNIQRMLRGVDLNYQLGEILLMFKLLTPDQLLAASLVSYGLISAQQISALGRIRQELHAIGLEYDLESLLILFRMLTPEQLREVRAGW